jgi:hypothetical protein
MDRRRFARTVVAEETENLTAWNFKREIIDRLEAAKALRKIADIDHDIGPTDGCVVTTVRTN